MLESRVEKCENGFVINVNGDRVPMYAYLSYQPEKAKYEDFKKVGVRLFSTGVYAGDRGINQITALRSFRPGFYREGDRFDFSAADEDFRRIVGDSRPGEIYLLPRLMLEMPKWWEDAHPRAQCRDAQGMSVHLSFSSGEWLAACSHVMERFQRWLEESGWDRYVIGWHLASGNTEEFIRPTIHAHQFQDYSEASCEAFALWLEEKYETIDRLNEAWHTRLGGFHDARIPTPAERAYGWRGDLRDGIAEARTIDYYRFYSREVSAFAQKLVRAAKRVTGHRQVMGIFYGNMVLCWPEHAHNDMSVLLADKEIDFLASPFAYSRARAQGIHWGFQAALDAARLHEKPFFVEADVRTSLSEPLSKSLPHASPVANDIYDGPVWLGPQTVEGSLGQMTRALADILTHSAALWWFDICGGWYDRPEYMAFQRRAAEIARASLTDAAERPVSTVCVFVDEDAPNHFAPSAGGTLAALIPDQMVELGAAGAGYHSYMLDDLERVSPDEYRMAVLLAPARLTERQRAALEKWKRGGRSVLFVLLPGFYGGGMKETTGFDVREGEGTMTARCVWKNQTFPTCEPALPDVEIEPARGDVVLARLEDGRPGVVMRREAEYQVFWSLAPCVPAALLREMIALSGGHIYNYSGDPVAADTRYIALHAASDGTKRIYVPGKGALKDAFTGEVLEGNETYTELRMRFGETRMLEIVRNA